jgi:hypothetical protein
MRTDAGSGPGSGRAGDENLRVRSCLFFMASPQSEGRFVYISRRPRALGVVKRESSFFLSGDPTDKHGRAAA